MSRKMDEHSFVCVCVCVGEKGVATLTRDPGVLWGFRQWQFGARPRQADRADEPGKACWASVLIRGGSPETGEHCALGEPEAMGYKKCMSWICEGNALDQQQLSSLLAAQAGHLPRTAGAMCSPRRKDNAEDDGPAHSRRAAARGLRRGVNVSFRLTDTGSDCRLFTALSPYLFRGVQEPHGRSPLVAEAVLYQTAPAPDAVLKHQWS